MKTETIDGVVWVSDDDGNRCSAAYFGSEDAAREALASLKNCRNCTNCSGCSRCSGCSDCSRCSRCSHVAFLYNKESLRGDPSVTNEPGVPPIPRIENIHQRVYEAVSQPKALNMSTWHSCGTTHCRAGWVTTLAGEAGKKLEEFHNTELAAMLIYRESGYHINPARFYDSNADALADMKRLAEVAAESVGENS